MFLRYWNSIQPRLNTYKESIFSLLNLKSYTSKLSKYNVFFSQYWDAIQPYLNTYKESIFSILNLKTRSSSELIGLDIGPDFLKLLKINRTNDSYQVENFAVEHLPVNIMTAESKDYIAVAATIKDMIKQTNINTKQVAIAISRSIAILKNITIDSRLTEKEIESRAWIEVQRHFPDLAGDIYLDFFITDQSPNAPQRDMTLVACRKNQINPYLEVLQLAGLQPKIVDVDSYAFVRALSLLIPPTQPPEIVALINMNTNMTTLIVAESDNLIYAHNQGHDGQKLISLTKDFLKNKEPPVTADELIKDDAYTAILTSNVSSHLHHVMHFFYTSRPNITIQKIFLSGDCATIPGLALFIQKEMNIETKVADLSQLALAPQVDETSFKMYAPSLMLCCGLALSKLGS